jgi:isopenicillin N synthase-like dioxygenase
LGYQSGSRHKKGSKGYLNPLVAAHTDVGMITVLLFDNGACAALQRSVAASGVECQSQRPEHEEWMDVNLPSTKYLEEGNDPIFVVNVGDCLSELTGGYLRSTLHRVIPRPFKSPQGNNGDLSRTSLALFVGLEPLAQLVLPSGESVTYEDWRRQRIARALDVMKK